MSRRQAPPPPPQPPALRASDVDHWMRLVGVDRLVVKRLAGGWHVAAFAKTAVAPKLRRGAATATRDEGLEVALGRLMDQVGRSR